MNEEEKKAVGLLKALNNLEKKCKIEKVPYKSEIKKISISLLPEEYGIFEILINLIEKLQKENEQLHKFILEGITIENSPFQNYQLDFLRKNFIPIQRIEKLIEELKQDDINMTRKYKEKKGITGELLGIDKVRVRAYREKTREINEKLHKLLIETKGE